MDKAVLPNPAQIRSFWGVARTLPWREDFAAERLSAGGFETFAPKVKAGRALGYLFPNYLFVFIVSQWQAIDRTPGVIKLVRFGDMPAKCPISEIEALRNRMDLTGVVRLPAPPARPPRHVFVKGEEVRILAGPLQGLAAVHSGMNAAEREVLLIAMLGATRRIAVPAHLVAPQ